jgi:hypothetical protein
MSSSLNPVTLSEWIALLHQNPEQANEHARWLRSYIKEQGLMTDPGDEISIENYTEAQNLLAKASDDPQQSEQIAHMAAVGQAILGSHPGHDDWLVLIQADPAFARLIYQELKTKQAALGLQTPQTVKTSIETYRSIITDQKTNAE